LYISKVFERRFHLCLLVTLAQHDQKPIKNIT
jgi:hypothetical protein